MIVIAEIDPDFFDKIYKYQMRIGFEQLVLLICQVIVMTQMYEWWVLLFIIRY